MPTLHGASASPFVRKVRVVLSEKELAYDHDPLVPFEVSDEYLKKSPLGLIPCWEEEDGYVLPDSSCIVAYLERKQPTPACYPADPKQLGRALWYEEYGDTKLVQISGRVFFQRFVRPAFLKEAADEELVRKTLEEDLPPVFDYLEGEVGDGFLVGDAFSIADIGICSPLVNFMHGGERVSEKRWPKLAAYAERILNRPSFATLIEKERAAFAA